MKTTASCPSCSKKFCILKLKQVPWPEKNPWNSVRPQKYKFSCPECGAILKPSSNLEPIAIRNYKILKLYLLGSIIQMFILNAYGHGIDGFAIFTILMFIYMVIGYNISSFKTINILGNGSLQMEVENDL
jgi:hypothetical protein